MIIDTYALTVNCSAKLALNTNTDTDFVRSNILYSRKHFGFYSFNMHASIRAF